MAKTLLVTGSSGLIGSEVCAYFARELGYTVHGVDNNQRAVFFGPQGDTRWNQQRLARELKGFVHHELDIRDRAGVLALVRDVRPESAVPPALRQVVLPASGELVEANALDAYRDVARVHQQMTIARNDFVRQIVFVCNIGLVDFAKDASGKARVRHVLLSQDAPDGLRPVEGTVHEIALAPAADPPPSLEFR